jgi:hypothetical protein
MKKLLENEKGLSLSLKAVLKDNKTQVDSDVEVKDINIVEVIAMLVAMNEAVVEGLNVPDIKSDVLKTLGTTLIELANDTFEEKEEKLLS